MAKKNLPSRPDLQEDELQEQIAKIAFQGWKNHLARFGALQKKIEGLLDEAVKKALANGGKLTADDIGKVFQKHPEIKRDLDAAIETLNKDLVAVIEKDSKDAWLRAQTNAQEITKTLAASNAQLAALLASGEDKAQNDRALRAFMKRKEAGMNLSDRVWKTTLGMKLDMERAIDVALAEGMSADRLSLKIRKLLKEPHRLYRRVRDKDGNLRLSQATQNYHPGTGVYRSSYKNAMRVARTEVNMAYQTSDSERWTNSWWVKGIRISLSNNHTIENAKGQKERLVDICDELAGDYPPDFKFTGWHPQCRCFATAITCSYDEIREYYRRKRAGEDMTDYEPEDLIKEPPPKFKSWMERNADRLAGAAERGTTPYFITNNPQYAVLDRKSWSHNEVIKHGQGIIEISNHVNRADSDFASITKTAKAFAEKGEQVFIAPKTTRPSNFEYDKIYGDLKDTPYYGKCPDLKIGDHWYEHEGFTTSNPKNAFRNMINDGLKQSDRLVINRPNLTDRFMRRSIYNRITKGATITEVWILEKDGSISRLY